VIPLPTPGQERVLVVAPTAADAHLSRSILEEADLACHVCRNVREVIVELDAGAGALLITDEALATDDAAALAALLRDQPFWSDLPILLLSASSAESATAVWAMERLGNVTVLERPVRVTTLVSALQTAIRARRRQYQLRDQLQAQSLLASVVQSSEDAIISKTLDGIITSWNAGAERVFGYSAREAIGQPITIIIPPDRLDEERMILELVRLGERLHHMDTVRRHKDGRRIDISVSISAIRDPTGKVVGASKVARDVTARRLATDRLRESEARFRFLAETIPSIVWTAAPDGTITYVNRRWLEYCGLTDRQNPGSWSELVLHPEDHERATKAWAWHLKEGRDFEIEVRNRRHDGEYRWFVTRAVPFRDDAGRILSWFGITTDIHEQKEMEEALRQADRRKDEFLATLAHELRNPLAPIRNALHIMRLKSDDPPTVEHMRKIMERQLSQMVRLVDDLLDVGRITRGKLELRKERVELGAVMRNAIDATRPLFEASGQELIATFVPQPVHLDADPVRLAQVLSNLLNNASKYMDRGGRVWLTAEQHGHEVSVSVRDQGIGIPADELPIIFEMFRQVDASLERSRGGLGIGLTLARQLVELHGGSIEARSEGEGKGAEFILHLSVAREAAADESPSDDETPERRHAKYRILVADDNRDAVESMEMMLRLMGNDVRTARDGLQVIEEAAKFRPDVAVLDIGMPYMNGYDAARRIRKERWGANMILVALTGWGQDEDKRHAIEAGFDLHFTKPVSPADLEKLMAELQDDGGSRSYGTTDR
jgi:PAS domain S-box-containing protein